MEDDVKSTKVISTAKISNEGSKAVAAIFRCLVSEIERGIFLSQPKYVLDMLLGVGMLGLSMWIL